LLDDDEDMAEMYLTEKSLQQQLEQTSDEDTVETPDHDVHDNGVDVNQTGPGAEISLEAGLGGGGEVNYEEDEDNLNSREQMFGASNLRDSRGTRASTTYSVTTTKLDVEELEMLLEAYFVQIDGTLNKLSTVSFLFNISLILGFYNIYKINSPVQQVKNTNVNDVVSIFCFLI
jgi:hypothetical protein